MQERYVTRVDGASIIRYKRVCHDDVQVYYCRLYDGAADIAMRAITNATLWLRCCFCLILAASLPPFTPPPRKAIFFDICHALRLALFMLMSYYAITLFISFMLIRCYADITLSFFAFHTPLPPLLLAMLFRYFRRF